MKIQLSFLTLSILAIICIIDSSCNQPKDLQPTDRELAQAYVEKEIPTKLDEEWETRFIIVDSLEIPSLNIHLFKVVADGTTDVDSYVLILDKESKRIFPLIDPGWSGYAKGIPHDFLKDFLHVDPWDHDLKTVNFQFFQMELFLNQSETIKNQPFNERGIDSVFRFYFDEYFYRIQTETQLDSIADLYVKEFPAPKWKKPFLEKVEFLKRKMLSPNVFLYQSNFAFPIEFFEIRSGREILGGDPKIKTIYDDMYHLKYGQL